MKKAYVLSVQPDPEGPPFGRIDDPVQIQKAQDYAHDHVAQVTRDLLMSGATGPLVVNGLGATASGALNVSIAAGNIVDQNGISYELTSAPSVQALVAADPANPRIDLIYATLVIDEPAENEFVLFRQLRTLAELEAGRDPYVPTQIEQPTELHTRLVVHVRTGTPAGSPAAPAAGAGEVALWQAHVAATQTVLVGGDLTDVRVTLKSLYQTVADLATKVSKAGDTMTGELILPLLSLFRDVLYTNTGANVGKVAAASDHNRQLGLGYDYVNDLAFLQSYLVGTGVKKLLLNPLGGLIGLLTALVPSGANKAVAIGGGVSIGSGVEAAAVPADGLIVGGHVTAGGSTNNSMLESAGSFAARYYGNGAVGYGLDDAHFTVELTAANSGVIAPDASTCPGRIYVVKSSTGTNNAFTPAGGQKVDGVAGAFAFTAAKQCRWFQSNGVDDWRIIGGYL